MPRAFRVAAFFAALAAAAAGILAAHAARGAWRWLAGEPWDGFSERYRSAPDRAAARIAALGRSLAARRRRPEPRHARPPVLPHPRPAIGGPGIGPLNVPVPWPASMPRKQSGWDGPFGDDRAEATETDLAAARPGRYLNHPRRWAA